MYKSVVCDGNFLVLVVDGIFDAPLMELPTEELADRVAFELQTAWEQGMEWESSQRKKVLNGSRGENDISVEIQKLRDMSPSELKVYHQRNNRRDERIKKVKEARRWRKVLSWK
ncbi:hypothetical protein [Paenibacillus albus]|uniref:Uncharacterized protein n=1 Tax=Paenibacillus albus TaxID=2495582 RepID=A0A3Q8X579_9BACL|nr:hypothetical protein [Paenibacillus albus]AZN39538.1 hypothetical protein EJC50_07580 [Paenibacillus albus]